MRKILLTFSFLLGLTVAYSQNYHTLPRQDTIINGKKFYLDPKVVTNDNGEQAIEYSPLDSITYIGRVWRDTEQAAIYIRSYLENYFAGYVLNKQGFNSGNQILQAQTGKNFYQIQTEGMGGRNNFPQFQGIWTVSQGDTSVTVLVDSLGIGRQVVSVNDATLVPQGKRIRFFPQAPGYTLIRDISTAPIINNGDVFEVAPYAGLNGYAKTIERVVEGEVQVRVVYRYVDWLGTGARAFKFSNWQTIE